LLESFKHVVKATSKRPAQTRYNQAIFENEKLVTKS